MANQVAPEIETHVVEFALEQPAYGQIRVANEMRKLGFSVSLAGVRGVWLRHDLSALQVEGIDVRDETITIRDTERLAAACGLDPLIDDPEDLSSSADTAPTSQPKKARSRRSHG